jgi:hypothetical protein
LTSAVTGIDGPLSLTCLTLITGGKTDMLPAEPVTPERRREIGGKDE